MVWICPENERGKIDKKNMTWQEVRREGRQKTIWVDRICGMMGEMGLMEEDWREKRKLVTENNWTNLNGCRQT